MNLFKKKKEEVDDRTDLERKFEEKGQQVGRKTGKIVQKGLDKFNRVYKDLEEEGKIDKVKEAVHKAEDKLQKAVEKAKTKGKKAIKKSKEKNKEQEEDLFYE